MGAALHPGYNARVNRPARKRRILAAAVSLAVLGSGGARAVYLDPDGVGQALIYPYYTVRSTAGNPFNTLVSVINHEATTKVLRVRFREGREGQSVASFNLYLSPYDMWTASVVPTGNGAKVVTSDQSCVNPAFAASGGQRELSFNDPAFAGDRMREGFIEVIEMATLSGLSANAVTHTPSGAPENCALVQDPAFAHTVNAPTGGLSGSATLINVASGMDFTFNAEALGELTTEPFYRNYTDPYPDWDAAEVTPVSFFSNQGTLYRFAWARGADAVSSVLMRVTLENEFVLDTSTRSDTDWIVTFPTRHHYKTDSHFQLRPFYIQCQALLLHVRDREEREDIRTGLPPTLCHSVNVLDFRNGAAPSGVFGSLNAPTMERYAGSGWVAAHVFRNPPEVEGLVSLPASSSRPLDGERVQPGEYQLRGLPIVGFMARTFQNGTLSCGANVCQGNYGGAFRHRTRRFILQAP